MLSQKSSNILSAVCSGNRRSARNRTPLVAVLLLFGVVRTSVANELIGWGSTNHGIAVFPPGITNVAQLSVGGNHVLLLAAGGSIVAWGWNYDGQTTVPPDITNAVAIAAGFNHSLALLEDGSVRAWGNNSYGQCSVPNDLKARAIAGGGSFSAAIKTDGTLAFWGNLGVSTDPPTDFTNLVQIAAGGSQVLGQRGDGQIVCWGGWPPFSVPPEATNVTKIAAGALHNLVLRADGTVVAWGDNTFGQLQVPTNLSNVVNIAAGGYQSVAVLRDGTVLAWGDTQVFTVPAGLTNVTIIAAGQVYALAYGALLPHGSAQPSTQTVFSGNPASLQVTATGTAPLQFQWQQDGVDIPDATNTILSLPAVQHRDAGAYRVVIRNKLGEATSDDATLTITDSPPLLSQGPSATTTFVGGELLLSLTAQGSMPMAFQWQKDGTALLDATNSILSLTPVTADAGGDYTLVFQNAFGSQTSAPITVRLLPVAWWGAANSRLGHLPVSLTNAVAISVRNWSLPTGLALLADGTVSTWGNSMLLNQPTGLTNVVAISAGDGFAMALRADGKVFAWGYNQEAHITPPTCLGRAVAIAAGGNHCLALQSDGTVMGWGDNTFNQATPPTNLNRVVAITAGFCHSVALLDNGTAVAWGVNVFGETNVPSTAVGLIAVAAGGDHTLGLKQDGSVIAWGYNTHGQAQVPTGLNNVVALAGADTYSMALRWDGSLVLWGDPEQATNGPAQLAGIQAICAANQSAYAILGETQMVQFVQASAPLLDTNGFCASFVGKRGGSYRFEFTDRLASDNWTLGIPLPSDGTKATMLDASAAGPRQFYRIRRLR